jgi:hypothetical protein
MQSTERKEEKRSVKKVKAIEKLFTYFFPFFRLAAFWATCVGFILPLLLLSLEFGTEYYRTQ